MIRAIVVAALVLQAAGTAVAGPLPPIAFLSIVYREVTPAMLFGTANMDARAVDPTGFLAVTASFSADGPVGEARILVNETAGTVRVVAVVQEPNSVQTYVIGRDRPVADLPSLGIRAAPAGRYMVRCTCPDGRKAVDLRATGLIIFTFGGESRLEHLDDASSALVDDWNFVSDGILADLLPPKS
ncbi:MAG: hypothetical protein H7243_10415 [Sphingomonadaceae bacterium]|nr:hypothetical protein [Sphingomonadaceae bacterium]